MKRAEYRGNPTAEDNMSKNKKPFTTCPTCGTPQVNESHGVVLYFADKSERDLLVDMVKNGQLKTATAYPVDPPPNKGVN